MLVSTLPEHVEAHRDRNWYREPELRLESALAAESLIERLGFCAALTDSRRPGPSLYIAVCGRRDAHAPRNVQKDPEMRLAWNLKDELLRRGRVYYGKFKGNRSMFVSRSLIGDFNALCGIKRQHEAKLSEPAQRILKVLRKEWEMGTRDLRAASGIQHRLTFNRALDELQRAFKVIPADVVYKPIFTYIWTLTEARFSDEFHRDVSQEEVRRAIAAAYLRGAGMTLRGELARVTGLSNPEAGLGNWALVDDGTAVRLSPGVYSLPELVRLEARRVATTG